MADELQRHQHMAPLVEEGLFEDAELTTAEYTRATGTAEPVREDSSPDAARRKKKRKLVVSGIASRDTVTEWSEQP